MSVQCGMPVTIISQEHLFVRFKVYQSKGRQDDIFMEGSGYKKVVSGLVELIGERSLSTFVVTIHMLHQMLREKLTADAPLDLDVLDDAVWVFIAKLDMLPKLGFNNDLKLEIAKFGSTFQPSDVGFESCLFAMGRLCEMNKYQFGLDLCRKIRPLCKDILQVFELKVYELRCIVGLGPYDARKFEAQLVELEELMVSVEEAPPGDRRRWIVEQEYAHCLIQLDRFARAVVVREKCLYYYEQWEQTENATHVMKYRKLMLLILYLESLQKVGNYDQAFEVSHKALGMLEGTNRNTKFHMGIYDYLGRGYLGMNNYFKSFICFLESARIAGFIDDYLSYLKDNTQTVYERLLTQDHH